MKPEYDLSWLQRLDDFTERFRDAFRRRDQARWAAVYLQGLLLPTRERKTIGTMARRVLLPPDLHVDDIGQALQNFVNQSPWDEQRVIQRYRVQLADGHIDPEGIFVVDELAVPKQGKHSVGVQRQYSSYLGRKTNCQVAVVLYHVGTLGVCPLSLRLYLPRSALANMVHLRTSGIPEEYRQSQNKAAIALELLDEVRAEGWPARVVVAGDGYGANRNFREALTERGLIYVTEVGLERPAVPDEHLFRPADGTSPALLSNHPFDKRLQSAWQSRIAARKLGQSLLQNYGLEHFEGRSWRGFHHHACLVLLAFAFQTLQNSMQNAE